MVTPQKIVAVVDKILAHPERISAVQVITHQQKIHLRFKYDGHPLQIALELDFLTEGKLVIENYAFGIGNQNYRALYRTTATALRVHRPKFSQLFNHLTPHLQ